MAQVSKYPISKDVADRIFEVFLKSLVQLKNTRETQALTEDLFTPTERIMLAKRLAIAHLLLHGYEYREIHKLLRVSPTTIRMVRLALDYGKNGYKHILDKIEKEEKLEDFFDSIAEGLLSVPAGIPKGGGGWRYLKEEVRISREKRANKPF